MFEDCCLEHSTGDHAITAFSAHGTSASQVVNTRSRETMVMGKLAIVCVRTTVAMVIVVVPVGVNPGPL